MRLFSSDATSGRSRWRTTDPHYRRHRSWEGRQRRSGRRRRWTVVAALAVAGGVAAAGVLFLHWASGDPAAALFLSGQWRVRTCRVFGPAAASAATTAGHYPVPAAARGDDDLASFQFYTRREQRDFLYQHGHHCQKGALGGKSVQKEVQSLLLRRFDELPEPYATELWKYCVLYTGVGNVYWQTDNLSPFRLLEDILPDDDRSSNLAIKLRGSSEESDDDEELHRLHHSFLRVTKPRSKVCLGMIRYLLETEHLDPRQLSETLAAYVRNDLHKRHAAKWKFYDASCQDATAAEDVSVAVGDVVPVRHRRTTVGRPCSAQQGEPCCQVWPAFGDARGVPVMALQHSHLVAPETEPTNPLPFHFAGRPSSETLTDDMLGMPAADLPYIATVREFLTGAPPATTYETPNYFDILLRNNCLPHDKECFKCLKLGYKENDEGGDCSVCQDKCPCYCNALCQVRPPPKRLAAEWEVTRPRFRVDPSRLIPRVIHQTYFEPVTKEGYPNMSRLIESFRQSGWEYEFYDDDQAAQFLSAHFPPQVREAYDAIIPGAFRADLFRYCVLLIRGGVYADMDILLESNLDEVIDGSIGFMTAQDSPGETIGHRSCLWNGLMAAAPGHPFLAQTIQQVVNNVRNRFTSVDYDDMLCPNPVLSVSHTVDTLFTCGPCILGASINDVLKLHRQTGFDYGEIDLFQAEKEQQEERRSTAPFAVEPDDPRLLVPGRSLLLRQNKEDMGSHRFTHANENLIVAVTDMPEYDDRPKSIEHYSKSHVKFGVYGLTKLYTDNKRANEVISIRIKP